MEEASINGQMVAGMMVSGKKVKCTGLEHSYMKMAVYTQDNMWMILRKVKENLLGPMEKYMMAGGTMVNNTVKLNLWMKKVTQDWLYGSKESVSNG